MAEKDDFTPLLEQYLQQQIPLRTGLCAQLSEAMRYSLLCGGKRIRPRLVALFCQACGKKKADALPFAAAVEMIHTYSLIHDDLPCMDDDDMRRGRPSNHAVYGEAMALLAGDALLTQAFAVLCSQEAVETLGASACAKACSVLAGRAGEAGMVGGQVIDLHTESRDVGLEELEQMDEGKTVALISAACELGCLAGAAAEKQLEAAKSYAKGIGMAFQIRDDVLDVIGDAKKLGKKVGVDGRNDRRNFVTLLGVEGAQQKVEQYTQQALQALQAFDGDTVPLRQLALSLCGREN